MQSMSTPAPTISSNSGCENQDGPAPSEVQSDSVPSETHDLGSSMSQSGFNPSGRLYNIFQLYQVSHNYYFLFLAVHLTTSLFHILKYQHHFFSIY